MTNQSYLKQFRTYQLAVEFYRAAKSFSIPRHLREQLLRAASSVALNLGEGSAKPTNKDKARFYSIALGSVRECQTIIDLAERADFQVIELCDRLGAHLYPLIEATRKSKWSLKSNTEPASDA